MKPSRQRRVEAVKAAVDFAYNNIKEMPKHFDDRQKRIFEKYVEHWQNKIAYFRDYWGDDL